MNRLKSVIDLFAWGIKDTFSVLLVLGGIILFLLLPGLFYVFLNKSLGNNWAMIIGVSLSACVVLIGLYWLYKIWTNPTLTRKQKWARSFGKSL